MLCLIVSFVVEMLKLMSLKEMLVQVMPGIIFFRFFALFTLTVKMFIDTEYYDKKRNIFLYNLFHERMTFQNKILQRFFVLTSVSEDNILTNSCRNRFSKESKSINVQGLRRFDRSQVSLWCLWGTYENDDLN